MRHGSGGYRVTVTRYCLCEQVIIFIKVTRSVMRYGSADIELQLQNIMNMEILLRS